jgi:outer membrane protein assembly factor BamE (lipoprotein component of BamABCDE complex)
MSFVNRKHYKIFYIIFFSFLINHCQLKDNKRAHGIVFLENREKVLITKKTNKNDVIKLIGNPHSTSLTGDDTWIYFERTIAKGKLVKLGQNVLTVNNVLELKFDKYGILTEKNFYKKDDMQKVKYSKDETKNDITKRSFIGKFLSSVKQKMQGERKF